MGTEEKDIKTYLVLFLVKERHVFYGEGINHYNINPRDPTKTIHAEVDAVNNLPITTKRKKVNVFVFRTNNKGDKLMMAKPCDNCMKYIHINIRRKGYRLHRIYYTNWEGELEYIK